MVMWDTRPAGEPQLCLMSNRVVKGVGSAEVCPGFINKRAVLVSEQRDKSAFNFGDSESSERLFRSRFLENAFKYGLQGSSEAASVVCNLPESPHSTVNFLF